LNDRAETSANKTRAIGDKRYVSQQFAVRFIHVSFVHRIRHPVNEHKIGSKKERVEQCIVHIHAPVRVVSIRFDRKLKCGLHIVQ
jgi:hypothetical protein